MWPIAVSRAIALGAVVMLCALACGEDADHASNGGAGGRSGSSGRAGTSAGGRAGSGGGSGSGAASGSGGVAASGGTGATAGNAGADGSVGSAGQAGSAGSSAGGASGNGGSNGASGSAGAAGAAGAAGSGGANGGRDGGSGGASGAAGSSGSAGRAGASGSDGGANRKFVGNITTSNNLRSDFLNYWDQLTPENEGKWASMEPTRDNMNWTKMDQYYQFTRTNRIPLKEHTFVWGAQAPSWINSLAQSEQAAEIEEWIRLFCERYPAVELIDVVNEPDHTKPDGGSGRANFYNALGGNGATGHDWVIRAFQLARQYCPNAKLILNDYNVLRWDTDAFIAIATKVKNAPQMGGRSLLDAIGTQCHGQETQALTGTVNGGSLTANLNKIIALGVPIYVTEFDLDIADDNQQRTVMQQQFTLLYETPQVVGVTLWGYIYGATWLPNTGLIRSDQPRPAMTWLMNYLGR